MDLFGRTFRYEKRAEESIREAKTAWANLEDILMALEWGIMHAPDIGPLLNEKGLRGFVFPGARSLDEPDIDVIYEATELEIVIHDLVFRQAKAHYAGRA